MTDKVVTAPGGNAFTAAVAVARQAVGVGLCSTIGRDPVGDFLIAEMQRAGVDARFVVQRPGCATPQSINVACEDTETRFIITMASPTIEWEAALQTKPAWLHFDNEGFRVAAAAIAARDTGGSKVSVDAGIAIGAADLTGIDLYAPTREQILAEFGGDLESAMRAAARAGAKDVVVTLGAEGSAVLTKDAVAYYPGYKVEVLSTLGAGDVFHGALIAGLVRGLDLHAAVRCANVSAALACRALDGQSAIPALPELDEHVRRYERAA